MRVLEDTQLEKPFSVATSCTKLLSVSSPSVTPDITMMRRRGLLKLKWDGRHGNRALAAVRAAVIPSYPVQSEPRTFFLPFNGMDWSG